MNLLNKIISYIDHYIILIISICFIPVTVIGVSIVFAIAKPISLKFGFIPDITYNEMIKNLIDIDFSLTKVN